MKIILFAFGVPSIYYLCSRNWTTAPKTATKGAKGRNPDLTEPK
jgi:hypothetical protein